MKTKGIAIAVLIAAIGGAGYFVYKKMKDKKTAALNQQSDADKAKAAADAKKAQDALDAATKKMNEKSTDITDINTYRGKVAKIQAVLGVAVDGIAGNQTNGAYDKKFKLTHGLISPKNIDTYYIRAVDKNYNPFLPFQLPKGSDFPKGPVPNAPAPKPYVPSPFDKF
jgi:uncharacterized protein YxeA